MNAIPRTTSSRMSFFLALALFTAYLTLFACRQPSQAPVGEGEGPGHRQQELALSPEDELKLGQKAYREVLAEGHPLPKSSPEVARVREVGERIAKTVEIEPLMREINLHVKEYRFEWEFTVLDNNSVNAFCLPGGKVAVFTGLLRMVHDDKDQLAGVLSHEVAHALAHHASERLAREEQEGKGLFAAIRELKYDREQESEADHIGVFLMTFAGYDPKQAVVFWKHMEQLEREHGKQPQILSDHPSSEQRIRQLEEWVPKALAGKKAYDEGRVAPPEDRRRR
jgi:metalloendopeptidase OMA1, mitochondrial